MSGLELTTAEREVLLHWCAGMTLLFDRKPQKGGDRDKMLLWKGLTEKVRAYEPTDANPTRSQIIAKMGKMLADAPFDSDQRRTMLSDVRKTNEFTGYDKAANAVMAGHHEIYLTMMLNWSLRYGLETDHEAREGNAAEHSGAPVVPGALVEHPLGDSEEHGRRESPNAGGSGEGRVSEDQPVHPSHGGGDGGSDVVPAAPYPSGSSVDF